MLEGVGSKRVMSEETWGAMMVVVGSSWGAVGSDVFAGVAMEMGASNRPSKSVL